MTEIKEQIEKIIKRQKELKGKCYIEEQKFIIEFKDEKLEM